MEKFCLEVAGDFACFTRPEMKVERVSYDVITPSAARSVFEAILWKPAIRWEVRKIEVLQPIRWISVRRNEVKSKASVSNVKEAMNGTRRDLEMFVEDERTQRASLLLRDVAYRIYAELVPVGDDEALAIAISETIEKPLPADVLRQAAEPYTTANSARSYLRAFGLALDERSPRL